jgi:hypothetical protein
MSSLLGLENSRAGRGGTTDLPYRQSADNQGSDNILSAGRWEDSIMDTGQAFLLLETTATLVAGVAWIRQLLSCPA